MGIQTGYDIDDPVFDRNVYRSNPNLQFLERWEQDSLISGCDRYFMALRGCDFAIASTPGMQSLISEHFSNPVYLWRNAIDAETLHNVATAEKQRQDTSEGKQREIVLTYASGSRAHEADFRVAEDALVEIMTRHSALRFSIIGHLDLPERLKPFAGRISFTPFSDYTSYIGHISESGILIVPLVDDPFNECKSAIRYLESAALGIPTVATATGDFKNIVEHGKTGFLASTTADWIEALERLIASRKLRNKIGRAGKERVLTTQTTSAIWQSLDRGMMAELLEGGQR